MAGTFSRIYIQIVFGVKKRQKLISPEWEDELYKYITGIITKKGQKLLVINGVQDHIHILIGMKPTCCLSDLVREIKKSSNSYINDNKLTNTKFEWQSGYGAFSYSYSAMPNVCKYIENQKERHKVNTFQEEYRELLNKFEVEFKDEYLFD